MVRISYARQAIHVQSQVKFDRNQTVFCFVLFSNVELFYYGYFDKHCSSG